MDVFKIKCPEVATAPAQTQEVEPNTSVNATTTLSPAPDPQGLKDALLQKRELIHLLEGYLSPVEEKALEEQVNQALSELDEILAALPKNEDAV